MVKTSKFLCFWHLDTQGPTIRGEFFLPEICLCQKSQKKIMKEIAKKKSKLWAPVLHMAVPDRQNTRLLLFGTQKPCSGVKIFPEKKIFFFRDFSKIDLSLVKTMKFRVRKTTF